MRVVHGLDWIEADTFVSKRNYAGSKFFGHHFVLQRTPQSLIVLISQATMGKDKFMF